MPPAANSSGDLVDASSADDHDDETVAEGDDEETLSPQPGVADPYANLDSAFGGYMADEPRPQGGDHLDELF